MRAFPSAGFIRVMVLLLVPVPVGVWAWAKANSVRTNGRPDLSFLEALRYEEPARAPEFSPEILAEGRRLAEGERARLLKLFPDLAIDAHPVPDEQNAFLQFHLLEVEFSVDAPPSVPSALQDCRVPLDRAAARQVLEAHSEWVAEATRIAALPESSNSNMPESFNGFVGARVPKSAADHLLLKARLAAADGDEAGALEAVALARRIAGHYRTVERPSLIGQTITNLIDFSVVSATLEGILPTLGASADLGKWRAVLASRDYSPQVLARIMRGEWHGAIEWLACHLVDAETAPPDPGRLLEVFTEGYSREVRRLDQLSWSSLDTTTGFPRPAAHRELSEESAQILDWSLVGNRAWYRGFQMAATICARGEAVLELLEREQNGEDLSRLTECETIDPMTGAPIAFDPEQRCLPKSTALRNGDIVIPVDPLPLPW